MKPRAWNPSRPAMISVVLCLITFALYFPALRHDFLTYDDQQYVTENSHVQSGLTWHAVLWAFKSLYASNWHPLTWLSHMLDWQIFGAHAWGHHLTNVLLHVANTLLLFRVLNRMTGATWRSAAVAALFGWHPLHVESVAWIAERKDVLSAFFSLLTVWAYAMSLEGGGPKADGRGQRPGPARGSYFLSLVLFALSLMSKPMAVTLPFVLLLLDYWPLRRFAFMNGEPVTRAATARLLLRCVAEKLPFLALAAASCILTIAAQGRSFSLVSLGGLPLGRRFAHALVTWAHYLAATFVPRHLAVAYPYPDHEPRGEVVGAGLLLFLITVLVLRFARRAPYLPVGWFWYLGTLVPVIGLVQVGDQAWADRYTYFPLIGLFIALIWGLAEFCLNRFSAAQGTQSTGSPKAAAAIIALAGVIALGMLVATSVQLRYWKDTRTLFEHAASVTERNGRALTMLGSFLAAEGKLDQAKKYYASALSYRPDDPEAHFFLARAFEQEGKPDQALSEYGQALWFRPLQERTHIAMGMLLAKKGEPEQAAAHYHAALAINPESPQAENNLARLLHSQGRLDEAISHYQAALRWDPRLAQAHNNLGVLLLQKDLTTEGVAELRQAVRFNASDAESQYNLAAALNQEQQWAEAADRFARLEHAHQQDSNFHCQFALALAHLDKTREAVSHYAQALLLRPDFPDALDGLSWILATDRRAELRNGTEALRMAELACELTGRKQPAMLATLAAAYAETGRFEDAAASAKTAQNLARAAGRRDLESKIQKMLESFQTGKPWREGPVQPPA